MQCPVDGTTLVMTDRSGVEIDYCPTCRGVWLDRGELDKIIERSASVAVPPPPPQPQHGYAEARGFRDQALDNQDRRGKRKKRGGLGDFLDDIFDF